MLAQARGFLGSDFATGLGGCQCIASLLGRQDCRTGLARHGVGLPFRLLGRASRVDRSRQQQRYIVLVARLDVHGLRGSGFGGRVCFGRRIFGGRFFRGRFFRRRFFRGRFFRGSVLGDRLLLRSTRGRAGPSRRRGGPQGGKEECAAFSRALFDLCRVGRPMAPQFLRQFAAQTRGCNRAQERIGLLLDPLRPIMPRGGICGAHRGVAQQVCFEE